ncbi:DEAD/DEAH box helicase [Leptolyngbya sp. FACHB-261]|nr:DEAD/DEAH box helicase [Leptolyngbya sp. FACHB-261]
MGSTSLDLASLFPFQLDEFQRSAIAALQAGRSIVVCAPTGSGKTLIGEYAIYRALAQGRRVFYTTPLKALSNQKLRDFRKMFGAEQVGLLTGDISINREAPILVMTTEIFRNMLYGTAIGEVGTSLARVEAVVLDECHYMNDRQRGTVWEESIIYCPAEVQLVALSATVANSDQLTDWIDQVHGPTELIYSTFRPVPLQFSFCNPKGLFPLLDGSGTRINPNLKANERHRNPKSGQPRGNRQEAPPLAFVLDQLRSRDMLPAIYFIFSRRGCDQAVAELGEMSLVNAAEADRLREQINHFLEQNPDAGRSGQVEPLYRGIAAHHAGILPAWKGLVEELFQQGLIKVVFATETLAAGINMPARTTVISSLSKRTDRGHRLLNPSEFLQMAGRAGRRGMDAQGYVVTVQTPFEGAKEAAYLCTAGADPLVSQFAPSYGMVLNLLQRHTMEEARSLIELSFGQYLATLHLRPQQEQVKKLTAELRSLETQFRDVDLELVNSYEKLKERLKEERRLLKILEQQAEEHAFHDQVALLQYAISGTLLTLAPNAQTPQPLEAVLVSRIPGPGQFPLLICLGADNRWRVIAANEVLLMHPDRPRLEAADHLSPPLELPLKRGSSRKGDEQTVVVARSIPPLPLPDPSPEVRQQLQRLGMVEDQIAAHPAHQWADRGNLAKKQRRYQQLRQELEVKQRQLGAQSQRHWREFLSLVEILQSFGCLEPLPAEPQSGSGRARARREGEEIHRPRQPEGMDRLQPTPVGQVAAALRGDNELWLALALASGELDDLAPHHLAAAVAALVSEAARPDSWAQYQPSGEVEEALSGLRGIRRQLFQLQRRHQVVMPVWLEYDLVGLVEQWALGLDWPDLIGGTSLDEGDVVRMMRRTLDLLAQLPHTPHLNEVLRQNAQRAIQLIDRFPVNEVV